MVAQAARAEEFPAVTLPAEQKADTVLSGLALEQSMDVRRSCQDTISIRPAKGRKVLLQRYNSGEKTWKTINRYTTGQIHTAKLTLHFPKKYWKNHKYTKWRVYLPETKTERAYISDTVLIYSRNRENLSLSAKSAVVVNASTGRVLYSKSMNAKRAQASTTKLMTALLALENLELDSSVTISGRAAQTPYSHIPLVTGDRIAVRDLLYSALLPSSNGAAVALAEAEAGSVNAFVKQMNKRAAALGCDNTHFANPHGLDADGHYSSAADLARIARQAYKSKAFRRIVKTKSYRFTTRRKKKSVSVTTTNRLLGNVTGVVGGKTGTTTRAGNCYVSFYQHHKQTYVTVVLGCPADSGRWSDSKTLYRYIRSYGW